MLEGTIPLRGGRERCALEIRELVVSCYDHGVGLGHVDDQAVREKLKSYESVVDDMHRQEAFSGGGN